ncbi:MAG TPA: twin-arginine translocase TatA/TatE family subunit [Gemmatimonadales bacterium]|jgi:sec-independent protein translocase protein TatA|nr:twin-arginine translocase TatA/TatE family subunit [Gemmatimonadales bacterium]
MPNLGFPEILMILVVVLLLFGAKRIPEIAGSFGKGIREFKRSLSEAKDAIDAPANTDNPSGRQLDAPAQTPTSGEPKRLSQ